MMKRGVIGILLSAAIALFPVSNIYATENDTYISQTAKDACAEYGKEYNICPELLQAIIERESSGKNNAVWGGM